MTEEDLLLVAYFYQTRADAEASNGCIKKAALSEKNPAGLKDHTVPRWLPLKKPIILETSDSAYCQSIRLRTKLIEGFLHANAKDGEFLDIDPRRVDKTGRISFFLGGNDISVPGHEDFKGEYLFGRIKAINGEKRIYFWPSREERALNHPAIIAYRDQTSGKWRSCCVALNPASIARFMRKTNLPLKNILALLEDEYFYRDEFTYYFEVIRKILKSFGW